MFIFIVSRALVPIYYESRQMAAMNNGEFSLYYGKMCSFRTSTRHCLVSTRFSTYFLEFVR